jgi:plastocyanin
MKWITFAGLAAAALAAGGCGGNSRAASLPGPPNTIHVIMKNIAYNPAVIHAKVGQTVTWTNRDDAPHNVTYHSGPRFDSSPTFTDGHSFTLKLTKAGVINYVCTIHPGMAGEIVVKR